jgi:hypothetical protein
MKHLHRLPLILIAGAFALTGAIGAYAATSGGGSGSEPPAKSLAEALHDGLTAPKPEGVSARIKFTNRLIEPAALKSRSPLLSGADGHIWLAADGRMRIDLHSEAGDGQLQIADNRLTLYDESTNTLYKTSVTKRGGGPLPEGLRLPNGLKLPDGIAMPEGIDLDNGKLPAPSVQLIEIALQFASREVELSDAQPANVAGRPAYTVRVSPRHDGGLLGAAEVSWDAERGVPLRGAIYAQGRSEPVLELAATDVEYEPVDDQNLELEAPSNAKTIEFDADEVSGEHKSSEGGHEAKGLEAVQAKVPFKISAPDELARLPRKSVTEVRIDGKSGAFITYGQGLGAIGVLETPESAGQGIDEALRGLPLPELSIEGATGRELATALGTLITFKRGGVTYLVAGLVPPAAAEAAARAL